MVKLMARKEINALANFSIIAQAKQAGLKVYRDDLYINYADMEKAIDELEDRAIEAAVKRILKIGREWMERIQTKEDLKKERLQLAAPLAAILFDQLIRKIWEHGQKTADQDLEKMGIDENWEIQSFAAGKQSTLDEDQLNADAFEWYDLYMRKLSKKTEMDVFQYMQPLILEHIEAGRTGKKLADALAADFARYGVVRTEIIARTESTKAFNWGRRYRFDGSSALAGYRYSAILDSRTTATCKALHGHSWEKTDPALNAYTPPNHFRCRSVLVPINRFADFNFNPPDDGWMDDLPDKERKVLERFMDSAWYPVKTMAAARKTPADLPPPAAPAPQEKEQPSPLDPVIKAQLAPEDIEAAENYLKAIDGMDFSNLRNRKKIMRQMATDLGLPESVVKTSTGSSAGSVSYYYRMKNGKRTVDVDEFKYKSNARDTDGSKWSTVLHEYYHLNYHTLIIDRKDMLEANWIKIEETFTETSSKYMTKLAKIQNTAAPSYSEYLIEMLPRLQQLPEFSDCQTFDDFGAKMLKYRFHPDHKTAEWKDLHERLKKTDWDLDATVAKYKDHVMENKERYIQDIYDGIYHPETKDKIPEDRLRKIISEGIDKGFEKNKNLAGYGEIWSQSIAMAMRDKGIIR